MPTYAEWNLLDCAGCRLSVTAATLGSAAPEKCPHCEKRVRVEVFPALTRDPATAQAANVAVIADESSCFYHPAKKAAVICDMCGRFLCPLCDIEHDGQHLCPACFEKASSPEKSPESATRFVYYDSIAMLWALGGALFWFVSFITAPIALFYVVRYWRTPLSAVRRSRWRFVLAAVISIAELALWVVLGLAAFGQVGA